MDVHLSRRDLLRYMGAAGVVTALPFGLGACIPTGTTPMPLAPDPSVRDRTFVGGSDVSLGQGGWCWFQSPRASFGPNGILWLGYSVAMTGTQADGSVRAMAYDTVNQTVASVRELAVTLEDDHTSPSVVTFGSETQISWALHSRVDYLDVATTTVTGPLTSQRIRRPDSLIAPGRGMSYASVHVVDGNRWLLYRGEEFSWSLLTSPDGVTWTPRGLVVKPQYNNARPYLHAESDGTQLHLVVNDGNPTEYRGTSAYVGTVNKLLEVTNAGGTVVGKVGSGAPKPSALTRVLSGAAATPEALDTDVWSCDLRLVAGVPTGILSRRDPWPAGSQTVGNFRHRYYWIQKRGPAWRVEPLCWAGAELEPSQPDYTGLGTLDPSHPGRVVVSTNVDPVSAAPLARWELFEGMRVGEGQWQWTAITQNSTEDNIRPFIAAGGPHKTLAWMRGTYRGWRLFDTRMVVRNAV